MNLARWTAFIACSLVYCGMAGFFPVIAQKTPKKATPMPTPPKVVAKSPKPTPKPTPTKGTLVLSTNIPDVEYQISQPESFRLLKGKLTPASGLSRTLALKPGEYGLTINHPGYQPFSRKFVLSGGKIETINALLIPVNSTRSSVSADALLEEGNRKLEAGDYSTAIKDYLQARELDPKQASKYNIALTMAYVERGKTKVTANNPVDAMEDFRTAVELSPNYGPALDHLAVLKGKTGAVESAIIDCQKALASVATNLSCPDYMPAWYAKVGEKAALDRNWETAEHAFKTASTLSPNEAEYQYRLGESLIFLNRPAEAERVLRDAIRLNPRSAKYVAALGVAYSNQGYYSLAQKPLEDAIQLDPRDAGNHYALGVVLQNLKKFKEAETAFDRAIQLDPTNKIYLESKRKVSSSSVNSSHPDIKVLKIDIDPLTEDALRCILRINRRTGTKVRGELTVLKVANSSNPVFIGKIQKTLKKDNEEITLIFQHSETVLDIQASTRTRIQLNIYLDEVPSSIITITPNLKSGELTFKEASF